MVKHLIVTKSLQALYIYLFICNVGERDLEGQVGGEEEEVVRHQVRGVGRIKVVEREERIVEQGFILKLVSHLLTLCSYTGYKGGSRLI